MKRFLGWLLLDPNEKIVRIKSWWPSREKHGIEWPVMLIDNRWGRRMTVAPIWDRAMFRFVFGVKPSNN